MKKHIVSFATANYFDSQDRQGVSARSLGFDHVWPWRPRELRTTRFFQANADKFSLKRGYGYWLWKPFIVLETLRQAADGDVVLYLDSGAELTARIDPLIELGLAGPGVVPFRLAGRKNRYWTRRDCLKAMGCDDERYLDLDQANSAFLLLVKNRFTLNLVEQWLAFASDPNVLTDSSDASSESPDFIEHRHDQSIFSLLVARERLPVFRDPSQYGNHLKLPRHRIDGEYLDRPYSDAPDVSSDYGTLINHHRKREPDPSLTKRLLRKIKRHLLVAPREREERRKLFRPERMSWLAPQGGRELSVADGIVYLAQDLGRPVRYLSFVAARDASGQELVQCVAERLSPEAICRVEADFFDEATASQSRPGRFNLIHFGRRNWPDELVRFWAFIERQDLLDESGFALIWDDLFYSQKAIENVWRRLRNSRPAAAIEKHTVQLRGETSQRAVAIIRSTPAPDSD